MDMIDMVRLNTEDLNVRFREGEGESLCIEYAYLGT